MSTSGPTARTLVSSSRGASASARRPARRAAAAPSPPIRRGATKSASASTRPASQQRAASVGAALDEQRGDLARAERGSASASEPPRAPRRPGGGGGAAARRTRRTGAVAGERASAVGREAAAAVEDDAQRGARRAGRRRAAVSSGSSASAVPLPTATASKSARQSCTSLRLSGEEIQRLSPCARRAPVQRGRQLEQHERAAPHDVDAERGVLTARPRLDVAAGESTAIPAARSRCEAPAVDLGVGSPIGAHDARDAGLDQRVGAGRLCGRGGCTARARRTPSRPRGGSLQASSALRSACGSPRRTCQPSPRTRPSRAMTQPTTGSGSPCGGRARPARACGRAAPRRARSRAGERARAPSRPRRGRRS